MSNTVEYGGLIGTVNTVYMLEDNTHVVLEGAGENGFEVSKIDGNGVTWYARTIYPSQLVAGTITKAPIKLEDCHPYSFESKSIGGGIGYYNEIRNAFDCNGSYVSREDCTNIQHLTVGEK